MNLIVRPDGTADLDDRPAGTVARAVLGSAWITANLIINDESVGRVMTLAGNREDVNTLAARLVRELVPAHFRFLGPVVLADLDAGTARLLLEIARQHD